MKKVNLYGIMVPQKVHDKFFGDDHHLDIMELSAEDQVLSARRFYTAYSKNKNTYAQHYIDEGNSKIARFLEYSVAEGEVYGMLEHENSVSLNQLEFHESVDLLIPTINKVENLVKVVGDEHECYELRLMGSGNAVIMTDKEQPVASASASTMAMAIWMTLVEFIDWAEAVGLVELEAEEF